MNRAPSTRPTRGTSRLVSLIVLAVAGLTSAGAQPSGSDPIHITAGQTGLIHVPGLSRVAVGDGEVVDAEVFEDTDEVLIIGKAPGTTDLRTWSGEAGSNRRLIVVRPRGGGDELPQVAHVLGDIAGVDARRMGDRILLTGRVETQADLERVGAVAERFDAVQTFVEGPGLVETPTIFIKARFVEVRKSSLEQIGLDWSDTSPGFTFSHVSDYVTNDLYRPGFPEFPSSGQWPLDVGTNNGYLGLGLSFNSVLDLLGQNGEANVIAEPTLSALSGSEAEFQAGGEVPIPVEGEDGGIEVIFKDYGILLKVAPEVGEGDLIRTSVEVEVSDIDESVTVRGVPGFSVRNAATEMNAASGETLVIAGLVDSQDSLAVDKVPGLGDVPLLGQLFKSRRFQEEKTELVVMVTPYLASDVPNWNEEYLQRADAIQSGEARGQFAIMD